MNSSAVDASQTTPLQHDEAVWLLETELQRTLDLLTGLDPNEWNAATDCPDWDVRRMYLHVLGACEGSASVSEGLHQLRAAGKRQKSEGGPLEANLSAVQVAARETVDSGQLAERLRAIAPQTVRARRRIPFVLRRWVKISVDGPVAEKWTLGYLVDTIYLRDLWMHRIDATRATGRNMGLTGAHDGRIVADVVGEWARRHKRPFTLELTGDAGGRFFVGEGGESIVIDALEFCRTLAGRSLGSGLLTTVVPF